MKHRRAANRTVAVGALAAALLVSACGGGSDSNDAPAATTGGATAETPATPPAATPHAATPAAMTMPAYAAQRSALAASAAPEAIGEVTQAARADDVQRAAAQLASGLAHGYPSTGSVPPIDRTVLRALGAAAAGDTLAELTSHVELAPSPAVAAAQTGGVVSQWWVERDLALSTTFLQATDLFGAVPRLAGWTGREASYADGGANTDADFNAALLAATGVPWTVNSLATPLNLRVLSVHSVSAAVNWSELPAFDGVFQASSESRVRLPMVRVPTGVKRHVGTDYTADVLASGSLRLVTVRPSSATLRAFAGTPLADAVTETLAAVAKAGAPAGEMVLPATGETWIGWSAARQLIEAGVSLAFNETQADLKGLDGTGGTYASVPESMLRLGFGASGVTLKAAAALAFTWSPKNVHGFTDPSGFDGTSLSPVCPWTAPADLNPFFVALIGPEGFVVGMVAVGSLDGTPVERPSCIVFSGPGG